MKKYIIYGIIGVFILLGIVALVKYCGYLKTENKRLNANQTALMDDVIKYRTKDSLSAASVQQLSLTNSEFKKHNAELVKEAENLNLKVKRLESASRTATKTVYQVETQWRDSIVFRDGRIDTIPCVSWRDNYLAFDMCGREGIVTPYIAITDTLIQFVHRVPRRFLFIKFGTKAIRQEVTSKNPHTTITYTEYIKLQK